MASKISVAAGCTAGAASACILWALYKRSQRKELPKVWRQVGTLADLLAYPVKSCGYVELIEAECTKIGLRVGSLRDRFLMIVDKHYNFISARAYPQLLRVRTSFEGSRLTLRHPDMEAYVLDLDGLGNSSQITTTLWGTRVQARDCGWETSEWFSRLLLGGADSLRLVYYASDKGRQPNMIANSVMRYTAEDTGAFPDETAYNLINEASVDELSSRLDGHVVKPRQFRPNFLLKGAAPFDEDNWKFVRIGDNVFEIVRPCVRCIMTTMDPDTGIKNENTEPLATLRSYRQAKDPFLRKAIGRSPRMGVQMALRSAAGGNVRIGDLIYASY